MLRRRPIAVQIMLLVAAAVLATAAVMIAITFNGPPPKAPPMMLGDIAAALRGTVEHRPGSERLHRSSARAEPLPEPGERRDAVIEGQLAAELGTDPDRVRAHVMQPPPPAPRPDAHPGSGPRMPRFLPGEGRFAWQSGDGWQVVRLDPAPISLPWWATVATATALVLATIIGLAWRLALAITRPLDRLAANVRGEGPDLHLTEDDGPSEIAVVAGTLAAFQRSQIDQVAQRTRMLSAIAHDLGTPLTRLAFRLEALPEAQRDAAQADIAAMRRLIEDSLALDRSGSEPAERFDLADLVAAMVEECAVQALPVTTDVTTSTPVIASQMALRRLIQNLIDNALRYGEAARLDLASDGTQALLTVRDRGPGFSAEMLAYGCQPFARGEVSRNRDTGGSGLGLAIAAAIAQQYRGALVLANGESGGEVQLSLPLAPNS